LLGSLDDQATDDALRDLLQIRRLQLSRTAPVHRAIFARTDPRRGRFVDTDLVVADTRADRADVIVDLGPLQSPESAVVGQRILFDGFLNQPAQAAAVLIMLARVARQRFYLPPGMVAAKIASSDPVVTSSWDRLRFESFSECCGMALRYDVLPGGLDAKPVAHGTTNVDLTGPTRIALAGVQGIDPLHLRITDAKENAVTFTSFDHSVSEAKVPLPQRWVRGFAEAQAAGATLVRRAEISSAEARRFWHALPRVDNASSQLYATPNGRGLRLTGSARPDAIPVGGAGRLRMIEPLLRYARSVTVYGPRSCTGPGVSLWQLNLPDGTLSCALSPTLSRGFSGEGGLLHQLSEPESAEDADRIVDYLNDDHNGELLTPTRLAADVGLTVTQVESGLAQLAAAGTVGYDAAQQGYFHRELPWTVEGPRPSTRGSWQRGSSSRTQRLSLPRPRMPQTRRSTSPMARAITAFAAGAQARRVPALG
jgi:hypothetical protein